MRSRSRSHSPPIPQFPLILTFSDNVFNNSFYTVRNEIMKKYDIDRLHISDDIPLSDGVFRFIYIYSSSLRAKIEGLKDILEVAFPDRTNAEVGVLIQSPIDPNTVIKNFTRNHGNVQVLPEIKNFPERQIKISGRIGDIEKSVKEIHGFTIDKRPSPEPKPPNLDKTSAKFVIPEECSRYFIGKNSLFTKRLKADFEVDVKIVKCDNLPCKNTENIVVVSGKTRHIKRSIKIVVEKIVEATENSLYNENIIKMLICSSYVKELIGPQGSIIKDISKKSGNAKIKVLSDSETEKNQEFTIVTVDGTLESKQEAAYKVYEILDKSVKYNPKPSTPDDKELKIFVSVPDQYVARLIGRDGENVKAIMSRSRCKISFQKASVSEIRSFEGERTRMCFVSGNSSCISKGVKLLLEQIAKLESI